MNYIRAQRIELALKPLTLWEKFLALFGTPCLEVFVPAGDEALYIAVGSSTVNIALEGADVAEFVYPQHMVQDVMYVEFEEYEHHDEEAA